MSSERQINRLLGLLATKMIWQQITLTNRLAHQTISSNKRRQWTARYHFNSIFWPLFVHIELLADNKVAHSLQTVKRNYVSMTNLCETVISQSLRDLWCFYMCLIATIVVEFGETVLCFTIRWNKYDYKL